MKTLAESIERVLDRISSRDSRPVMVHVIRSIDELKTRFEEPLLAVETGTIRSYTEEHESTRRIAEALGDRGQLISVDVSPEAIQVSRDVCRHLHNIEWVEADSISYLSGPQKERFHFAFLDSLNDEDVILGEFANVAPRIVDGGIVMIDDAGITSTLQTINRTSESRKGHKVWQLLRASGADYYVLRTPGAHGTQLRIDFSESNARRIRSALRSAA